MISGEIEWIEEQARKLVEKIIATKQEYMEYRGPEADEMKKMMVSDIIRVCEELLVYHEDYVELLSREIEILKAEVEKKEVKPERRVVRVQVPAPAIVIPRPQPPKQSLPSSTPSPASDLKANVNMLTDSEKIRAYELKTAGWTLKMIQSELKLASEWVARSAVSQGQLLSETLKGAATEEIAPEGEEMPAETENTPQQEPTPLENTEGHTTETSTEVTERGV